MRKTMDFWLGDGEDFESDLEYGVIHITPHDYSGDVGIWIRDTNADDRKTALASLRTLKDGIQSQIARLETWDDGGEEE